MKTILLRGPRATRRAARALAGEVARAGGRRAGALAIALVGELGAGKTTFVRAFARALGCRRAITSPTFLIMRRYRLPRARHARYHVLVHVDAYRLHAASQLRAVGVTEALADPRSIVLVEWADRIASVLPRDRITVRLHHGTRVSERRIAVTPARWYTGMKTHN